MTLAISLVAFIVFVSVCAIIGFAREADDWAKGHQYWFELWEIESHKACELEDIIRSEPRLRHILQPRDSKGHFTRGLQ